MTALDYLMAGRFDKAIKAYRIDLADYPDDGPTISSPTPRYRSVVAGLASAYMGAERYGDAIPLMERVHDHQKAKTPDAPGQHLYLSVAYWCLEDRVRAIELAHGLCAGILDSSVGMAPDLAGGATFGLILHYMAVTAGDEANRDYALRYLQKLNVKYDKRPRMFRYPVASVKQVLGEVAFEDALESATGGLENATGVRDLVAAYRAANGNRSTKAMLGVALFHDGAIRRANGDEAGCRRRMQEVFALGYQTEPVRWYLARHEVSAK